MSYMVLATDETLSLSLSLVKVSFIVNGQPIEVSRLPMPLSFARKAADLSELGGGELTTVYVFQRIDLDPLGFDAFAQNLCRDVEWLQNLSLALPVANARACVMVVATGRPILFIDTEGHNYARYTARLG